MQLFPIKIDIKIIFALNICMLDLFKVSEFIRDYQIISEFIEGYQQRKCFPRYFFINGYWTKYFKHSSDSPLASTVKI